MLRKQGLLALLSLMLLALPACAPDALPAGRETLVQVATIGALLEGFYDGTTTLGELRRYGDYGLGTFSTLDGEMVEVAGRFYQVRADGTAAPAAEGATTPFAAVTFFEADREGDPAAGLSLAGLQSYLDGLRPSSNVFYAVVIEGIFSYVKTRSVPAQTPPYPPLTAVTARQPTFELQDVRGTIVGFYCPAYASGVNVAGYHLHFLTADKTAGGHVLELTVQQAHAALDETPNFLMLLPGAGSAFYGASLTPATQGAVAQAEK